MAKSTGNNILPREILTGENTFLNFFSASVASFYVTNTLPQYIDFLMMQL
jgi:hypothetical protein